ncbi:hypothetical protein ATHL_01350 [Anaerolinea thermolimosa]|uniref:hypothetical protein n=1 Tax=Anaerolinea thermolimosa TaxID=229919 RepID=UPI00078482D4|nr:hypothetical protein [Anaerolinea thermolimosa]GAP06496.1 hypothetical protein ATHL_01350 [Anaerolinea thermolimosa]
MPDLKRFSLIKPTSQTPFHIDFDWWKSQDNNWRVYLFGYLCPEHQKAFSESSLNIQVDWVDKETAEVTTVDGLQHTLITHCARQPDFVTKNTSLVDAVFRIFLANGNSPLTPEELAKMIGRPPETILRTLAGTTVYKGIRPVQA